MSMIFGIPMEIFLFFIGMIIILSLSVIFNIIIIAKVPFAAFLRAGRKNNMLLLHPDKRRKMRFVVGKQLGGVVQTDKGFYDIDPEDVYLEEKSKSPIAIIYGMFGASINIEEATVSDRLKGMGIKNYAELVKFAQESPAHMITLQGSSVPIQNAVRYFNRNDRADLMEAEHQFAKAQSMVSKETDWNKWIKILIILGMVMVFAALAFAMIQSSSGSAAGSELSAALKQFTETTKVITQNGTTLK